MTKERFALIWQASDTLEEVSERTGYSRRYASVKAAKMRKAGTRLKVFASSEIVRAPSPAEAKAQLEREEALLADVLAKPPPELDELEEEGWDA